MEKWFVWDTEYPEDGSVVVEAANRAAAEKHYMEATDAPDGTEVSSARATPELLARREADGT